MEEFCSPTCDIHIALDEKITRIKKELNLLNAETEEMECMNVRTILKPGDIKGTGNLDKIAEEFRSPIRDIDIDIEKTTDRNLRTEKDVCMRSNGGLLNSGKGKNSGNLDDFAEESRSPVPNIDIALDIGDRGAKIETLNPGVYKARVPIARLINALDDEESEDKAGFRCAECAKCLTCKTSNKRTAISLREAREQQVIEESMKIDLNNRRVTVNYIFLKDPVEYLSSVHNNPSNYGQALKVYKTQCKKSNLVKDGMRVVHKDLVEKGFMVKLEDMKESKRLMIEDAPFQHFNPWRLVMKMDSVTTPVCMVEDPSMTKRNEILAKGENRIGLIFNIMI